MKKPPEGGSFIVRSTRGLTTRAISRASVHALSHKLMATEDKRYDDEGLKPGASFPPATALINADSWACFCRDVLRSAPNDASDRARRPPPRLCGRA